MTITSSELRTEARGGADERHAGEEDGHGHDRRDDADAGDGQEAARVEGEGEAPVREGEGHADDGRRLREVERQHPRRHAGRRSGC